ncbi:elicitor-responsive protein 1-like isoform X2 [Primulina huaijiensis]|uniref:elicitor-responsive protein 1-like isoform X2 n=1 Tax=Primulina huaijiensis TaxID=1492673 RepID=UPI003CC7828A
MATIYDISAAFHVPYNSMSVSGIQGQVLEITVVGCNKLRNTEWISRQDPYVCLDYASLKRRTRTCNGGGKNPTFHEKFEITLIEGFLEINITVWNSNKLTSDDFIGNGKLLLQGVLCQGYDDSCWPLQDRKGRHAGEVRLVMHYANAKVYILHLRIHDITCFDPIFEIRRARITCYYVIYILRVYHTLQAYNYRLLLLIPRCSFVHSIVRSTIRLEETGKR